MFFGTSIVPHSGGQQVPIRKPHCFHWDFDHGLQSLLECHQYRCLLQHSKSRKNVLLLFDTSFPLRPESSLEASVACAEVSGHASFCQLLLPPKFMLSTHHQYYRMLRACRSYHAGIPGNLSLTVCMAPCVARITCFIFLDFHIFFVDVCGRPLFLIFAVVVITTIVKVNWGWKRGR